MRHKLIPGFWGLFIIGAAACGSPGTSNFIDANSDGLDVTNDEIRAAAFDQGLVGSPTLQDLPPLTPAEQNLIHQRSELGRFLFFDRVLSGVEQTSCGTCHHPAFALGDGRSVARGVFCTPAEDGATITCESAPPTGSGGNVSGPGRTAPLNERNAPTVINAALFPRLMLNARFHFVDGSSTRIEDLDRSLGFQVQQPEGVLFTRSLLAAQAHKPVPSPIEMAGTFPFDGDLTVPGLSDSVRAGVADAVNNIPAYHQMFESAYPVGQPVLPGDPQIGPGDPITYGFIADAIAHFEERQLVMTDSPWDAFLAGDDDALSQQAKRGAWIFFNRGHCSTCHSGDLFTDFETHNIGGPQVGPGTRHSDPSDPKFRDLTTFDFGMEEITGARGDRFKFRTPPLRGVTLTPPYMHNGGYPTLEEAIRHHLKPQPSYASYDLDNVEADMQAAEGLKPVAAVFDKDNPVVLGPGGGRIRIKLSDDDVDDLIAFLASLTDPRMLELDGIAPQTLPSGLPADVPGPAEFEPLQ